MLAPLLRDNALELWDDTRIRAGDLWREEIQQALDRASVAVLLVSDNFLASEFIARNELPPLLKAAQAKRVKILWVYISECVYEHTAIGEYQAAHRPLKPLQGMTKAKQQTALKQVCKEIVQAVNGI